MRTHGRRIWASKEKKREREKKKYDYVCFACRRDLFFCSLILQWEILSNVLFNSEKYSQLKCNIAWNISNTLSLLSLNYSKNIFYNLACWRCWKKYISCRPRFIFFPSHWKKTWTRKSVIHMASVPLWVLFCFLKSVSTFRWLYNRTENF